MGCVTSKKAAVSVTPAPAEPLRRRAGGGVRKGVGSGEAPPPQGIEGGVAVGATSFRLRNLHRYIEGEQVAAGWPAWLSAVAGEAIHGWVPLRSDSFEKLEKIGQGTYSSVFRARDLDSGKIVALKKVRFDNFEPESVRFMAREIQILRSLDHPNVMKLEGLIASRMSCSIYLVFEYMEHDLAGLSSSPQIKFTEPQIKCYMHQLLSALEHCHSRGIIHRDIKGANLLVNNDGALKIADFGLANFLTLGQKQPLTSRVVTLWYRPPELLLGSTNYEATVDLWSVGCVFAELFIGKPILQGRTEVEQLHKIFKLCGSPSEEYWKTSKLPHATIFKPHHPYDNCLKEAFYSSLPPSAFKLLETFLSVEPEKRSTATSALMSEYFRTKPYACEPSSLPKYPPTKEIDAKSREESRRRKVPSRSHGLEATRRPRTYKQSREPSSLSKVAARPEEKRSDTVGVDNNGVKVELPRVNGDTRLFVDLQPMPNINRPGEGRHVKHISQGDVPFSGPLSVTASSGFAWVKKQKEDHSNIRSNSKSISRRHDSTDQPSFFQDKSSYDLKKQGNGDVIHENPSAKGHEPQELAKRVLLKKWSQLEHPDSFESSDSYRTQDFSETLRVKDSFSLKQNFLGFHDEEDRVEFSGPLLCQSHKVDELLQQRERRIRQAVRRSWFQRVAGRKHGR